MAKTRPQLSATKSDPSARALQLRAQAKLELEKRIGVSFKAFVSYVNPRFQWFRVNEEVAAVLDKVERGEIKRLMIFMPPRHGKSEMISRTLPSYYLFKHPDRRIILTSYAADLAMSLSRNARDNYQQSGRGLKDDASSMHDWETIENGGMLAAGVGGPITGRGADLAIIDDPIKNPEEAESATLREKQKQWYQSTLYTRLEPDASVILMMTRWHEDDLAGWLLRQEEFAPEGWYVMSLEAIKSDDKIAFPPSCTVHPDWRRTGEALCRERYDEYNLGRIKSKVGSRFWRSLYCQRPSADEGNIWKRAWFKRFSLTDPVTKQIVDIGYDWDLAYTKDDENAASAWIKGGRDNAGNAYLLDFGFDWLEFPPLMSLMVEKAGPHYIEAKASGKSAKQMLTQQNIYAEEIQVTGGDKIARTKITTPHAEAGHVFIADHIFDKLLDDERQGILKFPNAEFADVNDVVVQAINRLCGNALAGALDSKNVNVPQAESVTALESF